MELIIESWDGVLGIQASGCFAKFADSLICQKPDPVNIVDSETGSGTSVTRTVSILKGI